MFPLREIIKNKRILESHRLTIDRLYNVYKDSLYKGLVKCNRISPSKVDERHRPHAKTTHRATQHQGGRHEVKSFIGCSCCRGWERWARRESFIGAQLLPWMRTLSATQPKLHRSLRFVKTFSPSLPAGPLAPPCAALRQCSAFLARFPPARTNQTNPDSVPFVSMWRRCKTHRALLDGQIQILMQVKRWRYIENVQFDGEMNRWSILCLWQIVTLQTK